MEHPLIAVGIELEGAWKTDRGISLHGDSSVNCGDERGFQNGECVSPPIFMGKNLEKNIHSFLKDFYPDKVNRTCGLHIHLSMSTGYYSLLMKDDFWEYLKKKMVEWHSIHNLDDNYLSRVTGEDKRYCRLEFNPIRQVEQNQKYNDYRYCVLNFCFNIHGTMEFRAFPMFQNADKAYTMISEYINCVTEYIESKKNDIPVQIEKTIIND